MRENPFAKTFGVVMAKMPEKVSGSLNIRVFALAFLSKGHDSVPTVILRWIPDMRMGANPNPWKETTVQAMARPLTRV